MKKFLISAMLALGVMIHAAQIPVLLDDNTRSLNIKNFNLGRYPGQTLSYVAYPFTAAANITMGAAIAISSSTVAGLSCVIQSGTASDQTLLGIAVGTTITGQTGVIPTGAIVFVATEGVVNALIGGFLSPTVGVLYGASGTNGGLTPVAATGIMTPSSRTAGIVYTLETKATGADGLARCLIVR